MAKDHLSEQEKTLLQDATMQTVTIRARGATMLRRTNSATTQDTDQTATNPTTNDFPRTLTIPRWVTQDETTFPPRTSRYPTDLTTTWTTGSTKDRRERFAHFPHLQVLRYHDRNDHESQGGAAMWTRAAFVCSREGPARYDLFQAVGLQ